ncbi:MAG: hypothetical protein SWE60_01230 [Thermodesulfobacteriota bacterium]|nr:hypothetical protein [Thermodesulfobacteriota bacterium]
MASEDDKLHLASLIVSCNLIRYCRFALLCQQKGLRIAAITPNKVTNDSCMSARFGDTGGDNEITLWAHRLMAIANGCSKTGVGSR